MATKSATGKRKATVSEPKTSKKAKTSSKSGTSEKPSKSKKSKKNTDETEDAVEDGPPQDLATLFKGFGDESSEENDEDDEAPASNEVPLDLSLLPDANSASAKAVTKGDKASKTGDDPRVLYLSRVPHGFHEPQMRSYFSQFGELTHVRLARNRRTGASRHFAFLQFESAEVADIVARTMNNYLLFGHLLKCRLLSWDDVKRLGGVEGIFRGSGRRWKKIPWTAIERSRVSRTDREGWNKRIDKEQGRRKGKMEKLKALGYEFHAPDLKTVDSVPVRSAIEENGVKPKAIEDAPSQEEEQIKQLEAAPSRGMVAQAVTSTKEPKTSKDGQKVKEKRKSR